MTAYLRNTGAPGALGLVGQYLRPEDLQRGLVPIQQIREAVGDRMDIAIEAHSRWSLPAALQIARALEPYDVMWLEDVMPVDNVDDLARLRTETSVRLCVSERLFTRWGIRQVLEKGAAHVIMLDPVWCGGITESKKIAAAAETYHLPVAAHGAVGPVLGLAGAHLCAAMPNAMVLEVVRAHYLGWYNEVVTENIVVKDGHLELPRAPGLGTSLRPEVFSRRDAVVRISE
jgi:L-alanine-DL-glutamate epimerase-like enolase superfamily enzyme